MSTPPCFFPLLKLLLYSSLLLALLSCFIERSHTLQGTKSKTETHFHTVEFSSLLPASACTRSTGSIKRQSTLEVFHRHGPCSKLSQDKATTTQSLIEILSDDQSRVESIQAHLKPNTINPNKTKFIDTKTNLPVQSGRFLSSSNYLVTISLGTPTTPLTLIFDTGSDLTWTQCSPYAKSCYTQQDQIFDPSSSSTYSNISCTSSQCSQLLSATGNTPRCSTGTCVYQIQYGDQSFSVGFLSKDKLSLTPTDVFPDFVFGCGLNIQGLFGKTAGLIGLGRDPLSLISQTATKYGKYFSYCLPSTSSSTGHLTLGKNGAPNSAIKFTPFASSQGTSLYFITIVAISVGGAELPIDQSIFKSTGTIIDSGTVVTRLPPSAYSALTDAFKQKMTKYPSAPSYSLFDTCFDISNYTTVEIPTVSFTFGGGVVVDLAPSGILLTVYESRACLAFAGNGDVGDVGIFGNTQQKTLEVAYDVGGGRLGFGAAGCK